MGHSLVDYVMPIPISKSAIVCIFIVLASYCMLTISSRLHRLLGQIPARSKAYPALVGVLSLNEPSSLRYLALNVVRLDVSSRAGRPTRAVGPR